MKQPIKAGTIITPSTAQGIHFALSLQTSFEEI
jgi:hypothetical protein